METPQDQLKKAIEALQKSSQMDELLKELSTPQQPAEEVLYQMLKCLMSEISERRSLSQALEEAQRQIQQLSDLGEDLIRRVNHEMRTPLTSVKEGLGLLKENHLGGTTPEQQDFLKVMEQDMNRLTHLINTMLDLSEVEKGRFCLKRTWLDFRQVVKEAIAQERSGLEGRRIYMELTAVRPVYVDPKQMFQVIRALLANAIKYTPVDGTISIRLDRWENQIAFYIQDNGTGIREEDLPKLFKKFSRLSMYNPNQPRGVGLSLVLAKRIVEMHQGRILVASEKGRGTIFAVVLPMVAEDLTLEELQTSRPFPSPSA